MHNFVRHEVWFERFVFILIALNCATLATQNFSSFKPYEDVMDNAEDVFTLLFFVEMLVKMVGLGIFVRRGGYFHSGHNIVDFIIVAVSTYCLVDSWFIHTTMAATSGMTAARSFRLLRPLRTLSALGSLRAILRSITTAIARLTDVLLLTIIFAVFMCLIALQFFQDTLSHCCATVDPASLPLLALESSVAAVVTNSSRYFSVVDPAGICSLSGASVATLQSVVGLPDSAAAVAAAALLKLGSLSETVLNTSSMPEQYAPNVCPYGEYCLGCRNPEYGKIHFDTTLSASVTLYSLLFLEDWATIMYYVMDAKGFIVALYVVVVVFVGAIVILNLALAIVTDSFSNSVAIEHEIAAQLEAERKKSERDAARTTLSSGFLISPQIRSDAEKVHRADSGCLSRSREWLNTKVVSSTWFSVTTAILALVNTIVLAITYHGMPAKLSDAISLANLVFVGLFLVESLLKLAARPLRAFIKDPFDVFDLVVVVVSVVELSTENGSGVIIFRCVRLFRMMRLSPTLSRTWTVLARAITGTVSLIILMFVFAFLFAVLGMQLFSGKMCGLDTINPERVNTSVCTNVPRRNFDNVGYGMVSVFIIIAGDGWRAMMVDGMRALGDFSSLFYLACHLLGCFFLKNLFIAVLLSSTSEGGNSDSQEEVTPLNSGKEEEEEEEGEGEVEEMMFRQSQSFVVKQQPSLTLAPLATSLMFGEYDNIDRSTEEALALPAAKSNKGAKQRDDRSWPRRWAGYVVVSPFFSGVILLAIAFSMAALAIDDPILYPDHPLEKFGAWADIITAAVFAVEAILKLLHYGFWQDRKKTGSKGYFQYRWHFFDFALLVLAIIPIVLRRYNQMRTMDYFRVSRALRPWSLVGRYPRLSLIFRSLVASFTSLCNVGFFALLVWIVFAILGTNLFNGSFYACTDQTWGDVSYAGPLIKSRVDCLAANYTWTTTDFNFDHLGHSLVALFNVATMDNWDPIMFAGADAVSYDTAPTANNRPWMILFFVLYVVLMGFFIMNFFVSVMCNAYFDTKKKIEANLRHALIRSKVALLTPRQDDFLRMYRRAVLFFKPPLHVSYGKGSWRWTIREFVRAPFFEHTVFLCAVVHVLVEGSVFSESPVLSSEGFFYMDIAFTAFFTVVSLMKMIVYGVASYFDRRTRRVDVLLNIVTMCGIAHRFVVGGSTLTNQILLLARVGRMYRVLFVTTGMRMLIETLIASSKNILGVCFLLFLLFFFYAALGVVLFGRTRHDPVRDGGLSRFAGFERFDIAMLTLLRVATVDNWCCLIFSSSVEAPECDPNIADCGMKVVSHIYFMSFIVFGQWIAINLFTAVLMDSFTNAEREERFAIQEAHVVRFRSLWKSLVGDHGPMTLLELQTFTARLGPPIGPDFEKVSPTVSPTGGTPTTVHAKGSLPSSASLNSLPTSPMAEAPSYREVLRFLCKLDVATYDNRVCPQHVFDALVRHFYGVALPPEVEKQLTVLVDRQFETRQLIRARDDKGQGKHSSLRHAVCATIIQSQWRGARIRKVVTLTLQQQKRAKSKSMPLAADAKVGESRGRDGSGEPSLVLPIPKPTATTFSDG